MSKSMKCCYLDSNTLVRQSTVYSSLPFIIYAGKGQACLSSLTSLHAFLCVFGVFHSSISFYLASGLSLFVSKFDWTCILHFIRKYDFFFFCMCVSMGEMTTGFPAVRTTCSIPSFSGSFPQVLLFTPHGCSTLTRHVVLSVWPAISFCGEWSVYLCFSILGFWEYIRAPATET